MAIGKLRAALAALVFACCVLIAGFLLVNAESKQHFYLGFDRNDYPGDAALAQLRKTFTYAGYWLNTPPGATSNSWAGKRNTLATHRFGFLLLFNGRAYRNLHGADARALGQQDAAAAAAAAIKEGFRRNAVIFLDQEEGGVLLPEQFAYIAGWMDGMQGAGFKPGIYCSGIAVPQQDGTTTTTAADLRSKLGSRNIKIWVANDQCPPSPGCSYAKPVPNPTASGTTEAGVWQFAQSPRRAQFTERCAATYAEDGMCYVPGLPAGPQSFLDLNSSTSPDPSNAR